MYSDWGERKISHGTEISEGNGEQMTEFLYICFEITSLPGLQHGRVRGRVGPKNFSRDENLKHARVPGHQHGRARGRVELIKVTRECINIIFVCLSSYTAMLGAVLTWKTSCCSNIHAARSSTRPCSGPCCFQKHGQWLCPRGEKYQQE